MTQYIVEVELEDGEFGQRTSLNYGPFRSNRGAVVIAERIGKAAGLTQNSWGGWSTTDGDALFAFVRVRPVLHPTSWRSAVADIAKHFNREEPTE